MCLSPYLRIWWVGGGGDETALVRNLSPTRLVWPLELGRWTPTRLVWPLEMDS